MKRIPVISLISGLLAVLFTVYIALDTFVISRVYSAEGASLLSSGGSSIREDAEITADSYSDDCIQITVRTCRSYDTNIYAAEVVLSDPGYLKTALAHGVYGKNVTETTSQMAERVGAILAVNGDYYGVQESGYVIRNGVLYRSEPKAGADALVIYTDGRLGIVSQDEISAEELLADGAQQVLCFGPGLIRDGAVAVSRYDEVDKAKTSNPRTAIGIIDDLHYLFVVADGRTEESQGLSLYELALVMQELGAVTAYNLDGGGSSTMVFNGELVNVPVSSGRRSYSTTSERSVSDIVYIGY